MLRILILCGFIISLFVISPYAQEIHFSSGVKKFEPHSTKRFDVFSIAKNESGNAPEVEWKLSKSFKDHLGIQHDRYQVFYKNRKLIGGSAIVHSQGDFAESLSGRIEYDFSNVPEHPVFGQKMAEQIATGMMLNVLREKKVITENSSFNPTTKHIELCIIPSDFPEKTGKLILAYEVELAYQIWQTPYRMKHYLHAETGDDIASIDEIVHHNVPGKGLTNYYGQVSFDHDSIGPQEFHLRDYTRGEGIFVRNSKTNEGYVNTTKQWDYEQTSDKAAIDVMYGSQLLYDLLKNRFQFNSLDNQGTKLIGFVNNNLLNNAFWDGAGATFGGGDCYSYRSFTALDVIGHEFAHGITAYNSDLIYMGESGAINESFSDIMGKALEYYTYPNQFSWLIGNKIVRLGTDPIRSMSNPNSLDQPAYYKGNYWSDLSFDVHTNSGVMNYWFYLLVNGKNGINEKNIPYNVKAIGMDKTIELVFLLNTGYLTESSNYHDLFEYSKNLTETLYGIESDEYVAVVEAWKAVGLPEIIVENTSLKLTGMLNGSSDLNPQICWKESNTTNFSFVNDSKKVIPKDAIVKFYITANYNYSGSSVNEVLFNDNITLTDSVGKGDVIELPLEFSISPAVNYVNFASKITVIYTGTTYIQSFHCSVQFIHEQADPSKIFRAQTIYHDFVNRCDHSSNIHSVSAYTENNLCEGGEYVFEFEFDDSQQKISFFDTIQVVISRLSLGARPRIEYPNLGMFDRTSDLITRLFVWVQNERHLLISDTLAKYFPLHILENDIIDFQNLTHYRDEKNLIIAPCLFCNTDVLNQSFMVENDWSSSKINDCFSEEEFYGSIFENSFAALYMSHITGCFNTMDMIEPHLSLDLQLGTSSSNGKPEYRHGLFLYENAVQKTSPAIHTTGTDLITLTFPLNSLEINKIDLDIYLDGANATLDNIFIFDKFYSKIKNESINKYFSVTNPNISSIDIIWHIQNKDLTSISWFDQYGNKMTEHPASVTNIDCSSWPAGLYFYQFNILNKNFQGKVVVVK